MSSLQDWRWQQNKKSKGNHAAPSLGRPGVVKDISKTVSCFSKPWVAAAFLSSYAASHASLHGK